MTAPESRPIPERPAGGLDLTRVLRDELVRRSTTGADSPRHGPLPSESPAAAPSLSVVGINADRRSLLHRSTQAHPEDALLGLILPLEFDAVGVIADSVVATPAERGHRRGALAVGVGRDGDLASLLATNDEIVITHAPQGWVIDACLRAVGLPTPRCDVSPLAFPIALWLDRLMVSMVNTPAGQPVTWDHAVKLCPVPHRWRSLDAFDLGTTLASTTSSWAQMRRASAESRRSPVEVDPAHAAWMDDAMFARWCMGGFPDLASLRGDVEFLAPPEVAEGVEISLRAAWSAFAG